MFQFHYTCDSQSPDGVEQTRNEAICVMAIEDGYKLLVYWNLQGARGGYRYTFDKVAPYTKDVNTLQWFDSVARFARLKLVPPPTTEYIPFR